ncbi:hypothetical protein S40293_09903 [Stachybotrys chartarum IBT 40293]|nr:hypothetical protein S40293_09903 [Stachybotrys chartarum IBT 40293]
MSSDLYWLCLLTFIAWHITGCNASITDRSRSQFDHFFPTFEQYIRPQILINCSHELRDYQDYNIPDAPGIREHAQLLTGCILNVLGELDKASMAITGILLALLPVGLVNLGPSIAELSLLSARRPILAALLGFGAMSPNPSLPMEFTDLVERTPMKRSRYALFKKTPFLVKVAVSVAEYAIALAAASNCFYQIWRLTYRAVSLAPVAVYLRGLPEEATLFGWVALNLPIHLLGFATFSLAYAKTQSSHGDIIRPGFYRWLRNELTPCMYATAGNQTGTEEVAGPSSFRLNNTSLPSPSRGLRRSRRGKPSSKIGETAGSEAERVATTKPAPPSAPRRRRVAAEWRSALQGAAGLQVHEIPGQCCSTQSQHGLAKGVHQQVQPAKTAGQLGRRPTFDIDARQPLGGSRCKCDISPNTMASCMWRTKMPRRQRPVAHAAMLENREDGATPLLFERDRNRTCDRSPRSKIRGTLNKQKHSEVERLEAEASWMEGQLMLLRARLTFSPFCDFASLKRQDLQVRYAPLMPKVVGSEYRPFQQGLTLRALWERKRWGKEGRKVGWRNLQQTEMV